MKKINIEDIEKIIKDYRDAQKINIDEVELYLEGKKIEVTEGTIKEFKYMGLCFPNFIEMEFYKEENQTNEWLITYRYNIDDAGVKYLQEYHPIEWTKEQVIEEFKRKGLGNEIISVEKITHE